MAQLVKNPPASARDAGSILVSGRSPRVGNDDPLEYSCLENSMEYHSPWHHRIRHDWAHTQYKIG